MPKPRFVITIPENERREKLREIVTRLKEKGLSKKDRAKLIFLKSMLGFTNPILKGILVADEKELSLIEKYLRELEVKYQVKQLGSEGGQDYERGDD